MYYWNLTKTSDISYIFASKDFNFPEEVIFAYTFEKDPLLPAPREKYRLLLMIFATKATSLPSSGDSCKIKAVDND